MTDDQSISLRYHFESVNQQLSNIHSIDLQIISELKELGYSVKRTEKNMSVVLTLLLLMSAALIINIIHHW